MNTKLLAVAVLTSVFIISCGKKEDVQATKAEQPVAKKEVKRTVKPIILGADDNGSTKYDKSMTLSKEPQIKKPVMPAPAKPIDVIDVNDAPMFDTGMRPSNSK